MKKLFLILLGLISLNINAFGNDDGNCTIIIYRESSLAGSTVSYKISANDSLLVKIRNNTYFIFDCSPGEYTFMANNLQNTKVKLEAQEGNTYYLRFGLRSGFWTSYPELLLVDSISAYKVVNSGKLRLLKDYNEHLQRPRNRIGLTLNSGGGFENIPMILLQNGDNSNISFGGGFGVGLSYGYEVTKLVDISLDVFYRNIGLVPHVSNASIDFTSWGARVTPSLIIPIDGGYSMRLKLGAGVSYYVANTLSFDTRKVQGGFVDSWHYENSIGPHGKLIFEMSPVERWTMAYGLYIYNSNFKYSSSERTTYPLDNNLINGNGSGMDFSMKVFYNF